MALKLLLTAPLLVGVGCGGVASSLPEFSPTVEESLPDPTGSQSPGVATPSANSDTAGEDPIPGSNPPVEQERGTQEVDVRDTALPGTAAHIPPATNLVKFWRFSPSDTVELILVGGVNLLRLEKNPDGYTHVVYQGRHGWVHESSLADGFYGEDDFHIRQDGRPAPFFDFLEPSRKAGELPAGTDLKGYHVAPDGRVHVAYKGRQGWVAAEHLALGVNLPWQDEFADGATGEMVLHLQFRGREAGYGFLVTRTLDAHTRATIAAFQTLRGLPSTGLVDPATWRELDGALSEAFQARTLIRNITAPEVGTLEQPDASNSGPIQKYQDWYGGTGWNYCAGYVSWSLDQLLNHIPAPQRLTNFHIIWVPTATQYFKERNAWFVAADETPRMGDIVEVSTLGTGDDHIGFAMGYDRGQGVTFTNEGNTSGPAGMNQGVWEKTRPDSIIYGYGRLPTVLRAFTGGGPIRFN